MKSKKLLCWSERIYIKYVTKSNHGSSYAGMNQYSQSSVFNIRLSSLQNATGCSIDFEWDFLMYRGQLYLYNYHCKAIIALLNLGILFIQSGLIFLY